MKKIVQTSNAPKPIGPYNQAFQTGSYLFVSGQLAIDPKEGKLVEGDVSTQTKQVMENIRAILQSANFSLGDVVQSTVYLSSMTLFEEFNRQYAKYFSDNYPARTTVGAELKSGALVEVSVIAYKA